MKSSGHPVGWDEDRIKKVIDHYDNQTDEDGMVEDEAAFKGESETTMRIPADLVADVRRMISDYRKRVA